MDSLMRSSREPSGMIALIPISQVRSLQTRLVKGLCPQAAWRRGSGARIYWTPAGLDLVLLRGCAKPLQGSGPGTCTCPGDTNQGGCFPGPQAAPHLMGNAF